MIGVIKLLHKGYSWQFFMTYPSNFFAQPQLLGQSNDNPEGIRLPMCVPVMRKRQGNAGELKLDCGSLRGRCDRNS